MRLLIDTNRYTDFAVGVPEVVGRFARASEILVSVVVLGELRSGFAVGSRRTENERVLDEFLTYPQVRILSLDGETPRHYANVFRALRQVGRPIPTNDMWIAAQALQHGLVLDTRDSHFDRVPELKLA